MGNFNIEIVSDTVCPWCYIGQKQLELAIAILNSTTTKPHIFSTHWNPFYLNPDAPKYPGISKPLYLASRLGAARVSVIHTRLDAIGRPLGIIFKHGGHTGNTHDSHKIMYGVGEKEKHLGDSARGLQNRIMRAIFHWGFEQEGNITDCEALINVVVKASKEESIGPGESPDRALITESEVREWLDKEEIDREVDRLAQEAAEGGVDGVPSFTVNRRYLLTGARDANDFVDLFRMILGDPDGGAAKGRGDGVWVDLHQYTQQACDINGNNC